MTFLCPLCMPPKADDTAAGNREGINVCLQKTRTVRRREASMRSRPSTVPSGAHRCDRRGLLLDPLSAVSPTGPPPPRALGAWP